MKVVAIDRCPALESELIGKRTRPPQVAPPRPFVAADRKAEPRRDPRTDETLQARGDGGRHAA
jgi:hypothetical protein